MPNYSLFDIKKRDARLVVNSLKGLDFMGKRVYSEIAEADKNYARAAGRKSRKSNDDDFAPDFSNRNFDRKRKGGGRKSRKK